jgi:hypothetical protein
MNAQKQTEPSQAKLPTTTRKPWRRYLELANEPRINELHAEGRELVTRERDLAERLRRTAPTGETRSSRAGTFFYWMIGIFLAIAAFCFSLLSLEPYRLGWTGKLVCIGIALITPYAVHELLEAWENKNLTRAVITLVFLAALAGGILLAGIRADLLARQVQELTPAVVIDGQTPPPSESEPSFYDATRAPLELLMVLLALAIDLGSGVAIHRALESQRICGEDYGKLSSELAGVRVRLRAIVSELTSLGNAPQLFEAGFWRDFYRAMLTQSFRKAASKLLGISLFLVVLVGGGAFGQTQVNLVVAVDLSASEDVRGPDANTQFKENVAAVGNLLSHVSAGSKVTVIGITEESFSEPYVLLSAQLSDDPGYFGERLAAARQQLVNSWGRRSKDLAPNARKTDVLGAIFLASRIFDQGPAATKILVLCSDMRNTTDGLNLETQVDFDPESKLVALRQLGLMPNLHAVAVYVVGANAAGRSVTQWRNVSKFWADYFAEAGATLGSYSVLSEIPKLDR